MTEDPEGFMDLNEQADEQPKTIELKKKQLPTEEDEEEDVNKYW